MKDYRKINSLIEAHKAKIIDNWVDAVTFTGEENKEREKTDCSAILTLIHQCTLVQSEKIQSTKAYQLLEQELSSFATYRALNHFTPTQTANYLLVLKRIIYQLVSSEYPDSVSAEYITFNDFVDDLAVLTFRIYTDTREEVIKSQAYALEHDTPIVKISSSILLMPLMGIIDTMKAQKIIESLLESVVENQAEMAIIDMTAVPTFDTHVANNILKTIIAAKMVGTQVILSGISPNAAVTIVKLGVDLSHVETFNTLENAIAYGYSKTHTILSKEA